MNPHIQGLLNRLIREAKEKKIRVKIRMAELKGDWIRIPSRGPINEKGMKCIRWHFYQNAVRNHQRAAEEIKALIKETG